jgi:hypothetical protein
MYFSRGWSRSVETSVLPWIVIFLILLVASAGIELL